MCGCGFVVGFRETSLFLHVHDVTSLFWTLRRVNVRCPWVVRGSSTNFPAGLQRQLRFNHGPAQNSWANLAHYFFTILKHLKSAFRFYYQEAFIFTLYMYENTRRETKTRRRIGHWQEVLQTHLYHFFLEMEKAGNYRV